MHTKSIIPQLEENKPGKKQPTLPSQSGVTQSGETQSGVTQSGVTQSGVT